MLQLKEEELRFVAGGADDPGWFTCLSAYTPYAIGGSLCYSPTNDHVYGAFGVGVPGASIDGGFTTSLDSYLTGPTVQASMEGYFLGGNTGSLAAGISFGTTPVSASYTYGFDFGSLSSVFDAVSNFTSDLFSSICYPAFTWCSPYWS